MASWFFGALLALCLTYSFCNRSQIYDGRSVFRSANQITHQFNDSKFRIGHVEAGWVTQEIENGSVLNGPVDGLANCLQEPFQLPAAGSKSGDVADRTHRDFNKPPRINERLGRFLSLDNGLINLCAWLLSGCTQWMRG